MKGVILAGGLGTRLSPLTDATNKHLLPVFDKPMVFYPIQTLVKARIKDVMVVTSGPHAGHFIRVLKNGKELGLDHLEYGFQENPKGGISDALKVAETFVGKDSVTVILGDNTTDADISEAVASFKHGSTMFIKEVEDPERFGVPIFDETKTRITGIIEKPKVPPSRYASTGIYIFDNRCFEIIKTLKPSKRKQLEVTDLQDFYIKEGTMNWHHLNGFWMDAGTSETLIKAGIFWYEKHQSNNGKER